MRFLRPSLVRHFVLAALTLVGAVCTLEVGLTVRQVLRPRRDAFAGPSSVELTRSLMLERSWVCHHRLKPLQVHPLASATGGSFTLATNSFALRGVEAAVPKPRGTFRILVLGDEAVFASDVPEGDTFVGRMQEILRLDAPGVETMNGGTPGHCPLLSYLQFRHELAALRPDLVVLNFDMGDVADDHRYRRLTLRDGDSPSACPHPDFTTGNRDGTDDWNRFQTVRWVRKQLDAASPRPSAGDDREDIDALEGRFAWLRDDAPDWTIYAEQSLEPIESLRLLLEETGAALLVTAIPAPWQVSEKASNGPGVREAQGAAPDTVFRSRAPFEAVAAWCREHGIDFVDVSPAFQSEPEGEKLYLADAARLSPRGHELAARMLAEAIAARMTGPRPRNPWGPAYIEPPRSAGGPELERR